MPVGQQPNLSGISEESIQGQTVSFHWIWSNKEVMDDSSTVSLYLNHPSLSYCSKFSEKTLVISISNIIHVMSLFTNRHQKKKIKISSYPTQNLIVFLLLKIVRHNNERNSYVSNNKQNLWRKKKFFIIISNPIQHTLCNIHI